MDDSMIWLAVLAVFVFYIGKAMVIGFIIGLIARMIIRPDD